MVFTDGTWKYFSLLPHRVRAALAEAQAFVPFAYEEESFFKAYEALGQRWTKRRSQREVAKSLGLARDRFKELERRFVAYGTVGLLRELPQVEVAPQLERLAVLVKSARAHESASLALRLAKALDLPGASLPVVRQIQRSYGYGQNLDEKDVAHFSALQHLLDSVSRHLHQPCGYERPRGAKGFFDFDHDSFQQRVELFRTLSTCRKRRQLRPLLRQFGIHPNRFYTLRDRYLAYGIWGLVDLVQTTKQGQKISPELELQILEERLMDPSLSTTKMIEKLQLKCSKALVQKVYRRWSLSSFKRPVRLRGILSEAIPQHLERLPEPVECSAKTRFPDLIETANLKVNHGFERLVGCLARRPVLVSNPGAILLAPFLDQLGVVEALHTYGPPSFRSSQITNTLIVNILRILAGFPTIHALTENSDRSVAVGAGLSLNPASTRFYDSLDELRFEHLQRLRNDVACRARELGLLEGKVIAVDYHCDPSDSRYPQDKSLSKAPDKNGDLVYAHRPQILWDSLHNTLVNIAYCEGRSRAPSALYRFCEENLFQLIDPSVLTEIYADSEYTGERQLVYLMIRADADVTMCLKQNAKIRRWRDETIREGNWVSYGKEYRIASRDFVLPETGKSLRFVVKQSLDTHEVRCFGSTRTDYSPRKILDSYHLRWPVETGLKDLVENYFLDHPPGTSPEKVEAHYYCVMVARLTVDYFRSVFAAPQWRTPEEWQCVLSTMRTCLLSNQNCQLSLDDDGEFLLTYLDGDTKGLKARLAKMLEQRRTAGLNKVSWWGERAARVQVKNQYDF